MTEFSKLECASSPMLYGFGHFFVSKFEFISDFVLRISKFLFNNLSERGLTIQVIGPAVHGSTVEKLKALKRW